MQTPTLMPPKAEMEKAFARRDPGYDGVFFVAVRTTGIFCRPSCPSRPNPDNVEFLSSIRDCLFAGYRPCKRCDPEGVDGTLPPWVGELKRRAEAEPDRRWTAPELAELGITPGRARRWFLTHFGMTFAAWCRARRLGSAFARLREGGGIDEAGLESGFESASGFREAFRKVFGTAPGQARESGCCIRVAWLDSPMGSLVAGVIEDRICLLEFTGQSMLEANFRGLGDRFRAAVVPGETAMHARLGTQLAEYFEGRRDHFDLALATGGTPFQEKVWEELRRIRHGITISYDELAARIGSPTAQRAVARANGMNRISIVVPCHRVVGKDGALTGYGGGLWRKRLLLELERTGKLPGRGRIAAAP